MGGDHSIIQCSSWCGNSQLNTTNDGEIKISPIQQQSNKTPIDDINNNEQQQHFSKNIIAHEIEEQDKLDESVIQDYDYKWESNQPETSYAYQLSPTEQLNYYPTSQLRQFYKFLQSYKLRKFSKQYYKNLPKKMIPYLIPSLQRIYIGAWKKGKPYGVGQILFFKEIKNSILNSVSDLTPLKGMNNNQNQQGMLNAQDSNQKLWSAFGSKNSNKTNNKNEEQVQFIYINYINEIKSNEEIGDEDQKQQQSDNSKLPNTKKQLKGSLKSSSLTSQKKDENQWHYEITQKDLKKSNKKKQMQTQKSKKMNTQNSIQELVELIPDNDKNDIQENNKEHQPLLQKKESIKSKVSSTEKQEKKYMTFKQYEGEVREGKANGKGRLINLKFQYYEGDFQDDMFHGHGKLVKYQGANLQTAFTYDGEFKNNLPEGKGKESWPDGRKYEGEYKAGQKHGHGEFLWVYMKEIQSNNKSEQKKFEENTEIYIGDFCNNIFEGNGVYIWNDGKKYKGEFKNGKMEGKGLFEWPNKSSYDGQFKADQKHGYGIFKWPDQSLVEGNWENGKIQGFAVYKIAKNEISQEQSNFNSVNLDQHNSNINNNSEQKKEKDDKLLEKQQIQHSEQKEEDKKINQESNAEINAESKQVLLYQSQESSKIPQIQYGEWVQGQLLFNYLENSAFVKEYKEKIIEIQKQKELQDQQKQQQQLQIQQQQSQSKNDQNLNNGEEVKQQLFKDIDDKDEFNKKENNQNQLNSNIYLKSNQQSSQQIQQEKQEGEKKDNQSQHSRNKSRKNSQQIQQEKDDGVTKPVKSEI